jgi:hypothetical protein
MAFGSAAPGRSSTRAHRWSGSLGGAARVAVAGYVAGGRAALAAIVAADYDVLSATRRPGKLRTAAGLFTAFARGR